LDFGKESFAGHRASENLLAALLPEIGCPVSNAPEKLTFAEMQESPEVEAI
jgi:hypothetical protein